MGGMMEDLVNRNILDLMPYRAGKPADELFRQYNLKKTVQLASNENPFPLPENVAEAIRNEINFFGLYPDTDSYYLRKRIAEYNRVGLENVIMGSGSVELIKMIVRAFLKPGETVLTAKSTFPMFKGAAIEHGGRSAIVETEMDGGYGIDLDRMEQLVDERTKIIFIANPNNPTGTLLSKKRIHRFIDRIPENRIIVLDNAYQEYVVNSGEYPDGLDLALNRKNVIVLRTFSKVYALAGLRVGYAFSREETVSFLNRVKAPFNLTRVAQRAALASLENDDFKNKCVDLNRRNKEILFDQLQKMGLNPVPSAANFVLFFPGSDIDQIYEALLKEGVMIRALRPFGVPNGMRVTVGFEADNNFFVEKLGKILGSFNKV
jgi:histidinol-phosphate aminotransferase